MTYKQLIDIANANYLDGDHVARCFANPAKFDGDPLAAYLAEDLDGVAGYGKDDIDELITAAERVEFAMKQLGEVADAFRAEARRRENAQSTVE